MYFELLPWNGIDFDKLDERAKHYDVVLDCIHKTLDGTADDNQRVMYPDAMRVLYLALRDAVALTKEVGRLRTEIELGGDDLTKEVKRLREQNAWLKKDRETLLAEIENLEDLLEDAHWE